MAEIEWGEVATEFDTAFEGVDFEAIKAKVPEEYKSVLKDIKTPRGLVDSFANAQKMIGKRNENAIPGEKATEAEWESFYKKMGKPENSDDYTAEGVKLSDETLKAYREIFKNNNLTKKQAGGLLSKFSEIEANKSSAAEVEEKKYEEDQLRERKLKYGEKFEATNNIVESAIHKLSGDNKGFAEALNFLTKDNSYFEMFRQIGDVLRGANPNGPGEKNSGSTGVSIADQIKAYNDPTTREGKIRLGLIKHDEADRSRINAELKALYKKQAEEG